jgi:hypothetical protein
MQLVLSQAKVVMNQYDTTMVEHTNGTAIIGYTNGYNDDTIFPTENCNESIGEEIVTKELDTIQYDYDGNDTTITTSITYYCTKHIWVKNNNNYNNIIFNDSDYCNDKMKRIGEYQLRALRSEGQYKDEVYNAEEGMFQEPIPIKDTDMINDFATQNKENKKIDGKISLEKKYQLRALRSEGQYENEVYTANEGMFQEPIPVMCLCLCFLLIVTLRLLGQSMGSVKTHTGPTSKMSARLEARLESFRSSARTLQSCIQSDVFVCSSLLKLVCSFLLKPVCSFLHKEPRQVPRLQYCTLKCTEIPRVQYCTLKCTERLKSLLPRRKASI